MAFSPDYRTYPQSIGRHDRCGPGRRAPRIHAAGLQLDDAPGLLLTGIVAYAIANTGADRRVLPAGRQTPIGPMVRAPHRRWR